MGVSRDTLGVAVGRVAEGVASMGSLAVQEKIPKDTARRVTRSKAVQITRSLVQSPVAILRRSPFTLLCYQNILPTTLFW